MALSPSRCLAIFAVGASAITAAAIGVRATETNKVIEYYFNDNAAPLDRARSLANTVAILERRDSLAAAWRTAGARPDLELAFGPRVTADQRHILDSEARLFWREHVHGPARVRTVLMITTDSATTYRGVKVDGSLRQLLLPALTDGRTCALILPMYGGLVSRATSSYARANSLHGTLESNAGPCVWFAKYGLPGPAFGGWLSERDHNPAMSAVERAPSEILHPERAHTTAGAVASGWYSSSIGIAAAACLAGESARCDSVWSPRDFGTRAAMLPRGFIGTGRWWNENGPTGVLSRHFVARLEAELGPEKFARLWSSNASLDRAFTDVAGATLTEETRRMLLVDYGRLVGTPWPTAFEWTLQLGLIALSFGFLVLLTRRWRVLSA